MIARPTRTPITIPATAPLLSCEEEELLPEVVITGESVRVVDSSLGSYDGSEDGSSEIVGTDGIFVGL
jgi:hypothetical protein